MRALVCHALTGFPDLTITEIPSRPLAPGQVRIKVRAAGLNFSDTLITQGRYQVKAEPPFVPGFECAGEVIEVADGDSTFSVGDPVMAIPDFGAFAEELVVPEAYVFPLPKSFDPILAAAVPVAYGTAHLGLKHRADVQPGDCVVIHGAAGGVGLTGVEVAKALGATIIATAGGPEKLKIAEAAGADHLIDYKTEDIRLKVKDLTNQVGADVIYDPIGGDVFKASLRAIRPAGKILVVGFASGDVPDIPANILLVKNIDIIGYNWGAYKTLDPDLLHQSFADIFALIEGGVLKPPVTRVEPLSGVVAALADLKDRKTTGKVVVDLDLTD